VALTSLFGSLYYSEIVGYEPCKLCWLQRIFIYPQVLILIIALYLKDNKAVHYILWMSLFALGIASYHYLGQLGFTSLECGLVGYSVSCAERFVMNFGYITIPMMALTAMVMNIVFSIVKLTNKK
jgi:disulfide bond formation protein DsbB